MKFILSFFGVDPAVRRMEAWAGPAILMALLLANLVYVATGGTMEGDV